MEPPEGRMGEFFDVLNRTNDMLWTGAFTFWADQKLMVWRYGLLLSGEHIPGPEQIDRMIASAVMSAERFYPAFQMVAWSDYTPTAAMKLALEEGYGRA
jgi:hypothetical protein